MITGDNELTAINIAKKCQIMDIDQIGYVAVLKLDEE